MNIQIKCACGFESHGGQDVVVSNMAAHCVSVHNVQPDEASILAKARPLEEARPESLGAPNGTPRPEHANVTTLGLLVASWAVGAVGRRAKHAAAAKAAAMLEEHLRSAASQRAGASGVAETVGEPPVATCEPLEQRASGSSAPSERSDDSKAMTPERLLKLQRRQAEELMALRGIEGAINTFSGVKLGLGPH